MSCCRSLRRASRDCVSCCASSAAVSFRSASFSASINSSSTASDSSSLLPFFSSSSAVESLLELLLSSLGSRSLFFSSLSSFDFSLPSLLADLDDFFSSAGRSSVNTSSACSSRSILLERVTLCSLVVFRSSIAKSKRSLANVQRFSIERNSSWRLSMAAGSSGSAIADSICSVSKSRASSRLRNSFSAVTYSPLGSSNSFSNVCNCERSFSIDSFSSAICSASDSPSSDSPSMETDSGKTVS